MSFVIVAVMVVGALCALDLVLTLGVVKRLREHTELLAAGGPVGPSTLGVGAEVGAFSARTVDGQPLSPQRLSGETLVAFFSPTCEPCKAKMPTFVAYARTEPGGREQVLAVVVGEAATADAFVTELSPVARVVVEPPGGALASAFQAQAFPTILRIARNNDERLVVSDNQVRLDAPATVAA
ncbi:TlpA disulfide reductase family protein [Krasilnikovia sp. MM14-A1259]|uniref:TlpA disulfide reductase family protein n=1 Tax=Krasilnikovia sp. MM14-A1259 TaxID=3373539 RepID=UPI0037FE258E